MSNLPNETELFNILKTCHNIALGVQELTPEERDKIANYLDKLRKKEEEGQTFTVRDIVTRYLGYLKLNDSQDIQRIRALTDDEINQGIRKDINKIIDTFRYQTTGRIKI